MKKKFVMIIKSDKLQLGDSIFWCNSVMKSSIVVICAVVHTLTICNIIENYITQSFALLLFITIIFNDIMNNLLELIWKLLNRRNDQVLLSKIQIVSLSIIILFCTTFSFLCDLKLKGFSSNDLTLGTVNNRDSLEIDLSLNVNKIQLIVVDEGLFIDSTINISESDQKYLNHDK